MEETDDAYTVEIDLPGVAREDVDIQLDDRTLVADAVELPGGDHERAVAVLDEMVQTLESTARI